MENRVIMTGPNLKGGHIAPSLAKKRGCSCWVGGLPQAPSIPWKRNKGCCQDSVREGVFKVLGTVAVGGYPSQTPPHPLSIAHLVPWLCLDPCMGCSLHR